MIVCLCHGVNDREVRRVARGGAGSVEAVGRMCDAGTDCGSCQEQIAEIVDAENAASSRSESALQSLVLVAVP